jgi:putative ABC transport system permease protein
MTLLGIAAVVTIVVALAGVMDSFDRTLSASRAEALAGSSARMTVDLAAPEPANGPTVRQIMRAPSVGATQTSLRLPSTLTRDNRHVDVAMEVVGHDQRLWHPTLQAGSWAAGRPGLVLARRAAGQLHLRIGDRVTVRHPVPQPDGTVSLANSSLPVAAIHTSPLRFVAYANSEAAAAMHVAGLVNRVSLTPAAGADPQRVKAELIRIPGAGAAQSASAMTDAVDERMAQFREVLLITVVIAGAMALLIAFNAASINTDERTRENATMFAFGIPLARVLRGGIVEALIIGAAGTAVGVACGHALLSWMVGGTMATTMPDIAVLASVSSATYLQAVIAGVAVVAVAPLLTLRKLRRVDVPSALRVVE